MSRYPTLKIDKYLILCLSKGLKNFNSFVVKIIKQTSWKGLQEILSTKSVCLQVSKVNI